MSIFCRRTNDTTSPMMFVSARHVGGWPNAHAQEQCSVWLAIPRHHRHRIEQIYSVRQKMRAAQQDVCIPTQIVSITGRLTNGYAEANFSPF
jgi:hypothetical protein